jgi:hypothetical protein
MAHFFTSLTFQPTTLVHQDLILQKHLLVHLVLSRYGSLELAVVPPGLIKSMPPSCFFPQHFPGRIPVFFIQIVAVK